MFKEKFLVLFSCCIIFLAGCTTASGLKNSDVWISGETNRSALSYAPGEEMIHTFRLKYGSTTPGNWYLSYIRRGDDGKSFSGKVPISETLTVKTSLANPGFVSIDVKVVDEKGNDVQFEYLKKGKKTPRTIAFYSGSAVQPEKLADCGEPAGFDDFWAKQKKRLDDVPFRSTVRLKRVREVENGYVYAVSIPCPGPRPATGYLYYPKDARRGSLKAEIRFFGYGNTRQEIPDKFDDGKLMFFLNAHGQELGREDEYYRDFFRSIGSGSHGYAFDPEQNKDPENCFFNGMVLRILRAMEYLKSFPEWNRIDLIARGPSQGGMQAIWAAALDPEVTEVYAHVPWGCDLAGTAKAGRLHGSWRLEYVPGLDYYDPVFMAKRITRALVEITRSGLGDYVCPPSGHAVLYRNLATPLKSIRWVQGSSHGFVPRESEVIVWKNHK